ncbi:hypothetical protein ColTof4_07082 [Colletotrichum tofieldiae]|uniref:Uncharacterized protein n=1 Tax=Colletotrichum tofieldiae TaxID=708197 RepID=A0A161YPA2_9PEZI|nr:hypothetical protein CT0861_08281 [Colletotrichum tofieldiae]GKT64687.1 hypothetical protein ColTof3_12026 [Colletotrichum tofieldiae]GKT74659.1 hypothetical protein ColTof4_07082 [Colletotrichum tofieldiae]GKT91848.1 hypothetical protein Ct61P_09698 [Colletotrichum tofieldiae]
MAEGCDLPAPAQGDVYTHDGELKITNAAANIFVVYDRQPQGAACSPSSLSVEFVLGNVYLIDSAYFSPSMWGSSRLFGNLIKGLGLDFEGCRRGNTYVKTVYDDVVCVVGNQRGTACSIGTVAGNLITVLDLSQVFGHPKPHNVAVSYIHGLTLHESHLAYGGGLHRAYSTWASMVFPAASRISPLEPFESNGIEKRRVPSGTEKPTVWGEHAELEQQNLVHHTDQLINIITNQEKAWQKVLDAKRQAASAIQETNMRKLGLLSLERDFGSASHPKHLQSFVGPAPTCGNCLRVGHQVRDCIGPVDSHGFIAACPLCNKKDHLYEQCGSRLRLKKSERKAMDFEYLVMWRQNKAPLRSYICWVMAWVKYECPRMTLPHTKAFALKLSNIETAITPYPDWRTYRYPTSEAEFKSENHTLSRDPNTVYEGGRRCNLAPGSQSVSPSLGHGTFRTKMEQLGIKLYPKTRVPIRKASKRKQKKSQSNMDGSRFATGANCTILQRPLPEAPPVHNIASVKVEQEDED